jgi:hypothetical protein
MYITKRPAPRQLLIKHYPLMQKGIGLLFVLAGLSVIFLVFPTHVSLHCDRTGNICILEQSNLFRSRNTGIALLDITAARLESVESQNVGSNLINTSHRIRLETRHGSIPFTPYSIGLSKNEKTETVSKINSYIKDPSQSTLDLVEDERFAFGLLSAGLICFGLLPLCFVRTVTCRLDKTENRFFLKGGGLWGFKKVERRLSDLSESSLGATREGGEQMCRIVFRFVSGQKVALTYYRYPGTEKPRKIVNEINDFLANG